MQLRQCEYFDAVVRHGSMRAAAKHLIVSEPTISAQLRALERELKIDLFARRGRGVELTPEGEVLAPLIAQVLTAAESVQQTVRELRQVSGPIRVGIVPTYASLFVAELLDLCHQDFPGVWLEILEGGALTLEKDVLSGGLDVAFVTRSAALGEADANLAVIPITRGRLVAVVGPKHPLAGELDVSLSALATQPLLLFRPGYLVHALALKMLGEDAARQAFYVSDHSDSAMEMVRQGRGVSFAVDVGVVNPDPRQEDLVHLEIQGAPAAELSCVYARHRYLPKSFAESAAARLRRLIDSGNRR